MLHVVKRTEQTRTFLKLHVREIDDLVSYWYLKNILRVKIRNGSVEISSGGLSVGWLFTTCIHLSKASRKGLGVFGFETMATATY